MPNLIHIRPVIEFGVLGENAPFIQNTIYDQLVADMGGGIMYCNIM